MGRKSFFTDRSKRLYFIHERQLKGITEANCSILFSYLEIKWNDIQNEYEKLNRGKKENIPVVIQFDIETYQKLTKGFTNKMILPIGFGQNEIIAVFVEKNIMKAIEKQEETITVKEAKEIAGTNGDTIRRWLKNGDIIHTRKPAGKSVRIFINRLDFERYLSTRKAKHKH